MLIWCNPVLLRFKQLWYSQVLYYFLTNGTFSAKETRGLVDRAIFLRDWW